MSTAIVNQLDQARMMGLSGDIESALQLLENVLEALPGNIDALRLKGNLMELRILAEMGSAPLDKIRGELSTIRGCYHAILSVKPNDSKTMKDLADHEKNFGDQATAMTLYKGLIGYLKNAAANGEQVNEELEEAQGEYSELVNAEQIRLISSK